VSKALVDEEPLWLLLVGPSGGGKTEAIKLLATLAEGRVDELTRAGLLSWSPGKKAKAVGLLTRIPTSALVTISDFSTVVTMGDREARARVRDAAGGLRRSGLPVHRWAGLNRWRGTRMGGDLTLIAGATPVVDTHTSFEGALGERWLMLRLPESVTDRSRDRARFMVRREEATELREQAQAATRDLVLRAREHVPARLSEALEDHLVEVALAVGLARTASRTWGRASTASSPGCPPRRNPPASPDS
jgi:hypothetical protein